MKNINWRNVLTILLFLIIGFGIGMITTFEIVFKKLENHNIKIEPLYKVIREWNF